METLGNIENPKNPNGKYYCKFCTFGTSHLGDWKKHLLTSKHKKRQIVANHPHNCICGKSFTRKDSLNRHKRACEYVENVKAKNPENPICFQMFPQHSEANICECGKSYKTRSGLWKHQKQCWITSDKTGDVNGETANDQVLEILGSLKQDNEKLNAKLEQTCEDNKVLRDEIQELKSGVMTAVSEPRIVNNNNNINFFLNNQCSDAMAIADFAKGLVMCLEDVNYALENGKIKGIENIIRKRFDELGVYKRPLHCTDAKRGTLYVKGEEGWEKEKGEMNKMIRDVEFAQSKGIKLWSDANPDFAEGDTRLMDKWLRIVHCLTSSIEGGGFKKIAKRCQEMCKIDSESIT